MLEISDSRGVRGSGALSVEPDGDRTEALELGIAELLGSLIRVARARGVLALKEEACRSLAEESGAVGGVLPFTRVEGLREAVVEDLPEAALEDEPVVVGGDLMDLAPAAHGVLNVLVDALVRIRGVDLAGGVDLVEAIVVPEAVRERAAA